MSDFVPAYLRLPSGELERRAAEAVAALGACRLCPRACYVNRLADRWSACKTGRYAVVSDVFAHFGEESCLTGDRGSGTIFFAHCNLRCVFCQNFEISQGVRAGRWPGVWPEDLAEGMLALQAGGCHNLNLVTPEHVVPQVLEALAIAARRGLRLPVVYNTSAYDSLESLRLLDGIVDIYMPDFKVWSGETAHRLLKAEDYPEAARAAIAEMHRQVGFLDIGPDGLARRGVLVRHLVMPGLGEETRAILGWLAEALGPETYVNVMDQYRPAARVTGGRYPEIDRRPHPAELEDAFRAAGDLGLRLDTALAD